MIRSSSSSSRSLHKLTALYKTLSSAPSCQSPVTATAIRRFTNDAIIGNTRKTGDFSSIVSLKSRIPLARINAGGNISYYVARSFASKASRSTSKNASETRKEVTTVEDPFDAPTYNIPEKPMTFTEGASYSVVILAGLGIAAAAGYGVFKELIFEPKEYKVFNKALRRIQDDSQVYVMIGSPITGYGQESRNRAARQRIPNRVWKDDDGVEHVEVQFYIRGPHGAGRVFTEMFKDQEDKQWKFMYLQVEINSPSPSRMLLESYLPA
ncbi:putative mitochondrial import inner membrane translocase subunit TIM21 [Bidens hawaiensis]|uniref:putative mitochondrial import inner membrane translocase subunit TIM21 n=1 Tax=Bidens hawaiensis TaxID=980011 RepID=UPI004049239F